MAIELPKTPLKDSIGWDELQFREGRSKRKPLRRFVVLAYEDGWFIAMGGFYFFGNAQRYAEKLKNAGLTAETKIWDSSSSGPHMLGAIYPEGFVR